MWSFFSQIVSSSRTPLTVVVVDQNHTGQPVQHTVEPRRVLTIVVAAALVLAVLVGLLVWWSPLGGGVTTDQAETARQQTERLAALEDSLALQREYVEHFRRLMTRAAGPVDDEARPAPVAPAPAYEAPSSRTSPYTPRPAATQTGAAVAAAWTGEPTTRLRPDDAGGLPLPAPAPVQGFVTRGFDARANHFGVDIATGTGSVVRTVGDGFVIFADWTYEGGHSLAVQHADGYVSVYKHNEQLLRRVGERVRARDAVAISGNSGEVTTGPHLHFELWRDGLPQDPRAFVVGW